MAQLTVITREAVNARYLAVEAEVRYWEDAKVNGVEDEEGTLIPFRKGDSWAPVFDIDAGTIEDWPEGTTASVHYKVCDAGRYTLLDEKRREIASIDGYVPAIMSPGGQGYGDYIIMAVREDGTIADWRVTLEAFEGEEE